MIVLRRFKQPLALSLVICLLLSSFLFPAEGLMTVDAAIESEEEPINLIQNGGFEEGNAGVLPLHWGRATFTGSPQYAVDDTVARTGSRSARIQAEISSRGVFNQEFILSEEQRGKSYTLQQWMKTEDFTGNAYFRIQVYDQDNNRIDYIESSRIYQSEDEWTLVEMEVFLPDNTVRILWDTFFENGSGTVWYDDTRFVETVAEERPLLQNGGFEEVSASGLPEHWGRSTFTGSPQYSVDDTVARSGSRSAKIHAETSSRGVFNQEIFLSQDQREKNYRIEQWMKTEDFTGVAYFRIQIYDEDGNRIDYVESNRIYEADDWRLAKIDVYISEQASRILWDTFFENGTGTVWYDDTEFIETVEDERNLMRNGGFEEVNARGLPDQWATATFTGSPQYSVDDAVARSDLRAAKIHADQTSRGAFTQRISIWPEQRGKVYRIEQWMKAEDFTGSAYFRIQVYDENDNRIDYVESDRIYEADDWTLVEMEVFLQEDTVRVLWEVFYENGTGTVWYDDTRFYEYIPVTEIQLNHEQLVMQPGETGQLTASLIPHNASEHDVVWESSDDSIVNVDEGLVTAQTNGVAAVTVRSTNGVKADSVIIVGEATGITVPDYEESVRQGGFVTGNVGATTDTGGGITYTKLTDPDHGYVLVKADGQWTYYPDRNYEGTDRFHVAVHDEAGNYNFSKVTLHVEPVYWPPVLEEVIQPTDKNTPVNGEMIVVEKNGEALSFQVEDQPLHGQAELDALSGDWTFTPNTDYVGSDSFTVRVTNEHGEHAVTKVRLYVAPTAEEIIDELKANNPNRSHPRLLATDADFSRIRSLLDNNDEKMVQWFEPIRTSADSMLTQPPYEYNKPDGLRLDTTASRRVTTLAFVYQLTGDSAYAERAWEEMEFVASDAYPDWSPGHYLDTATMTHGIALGYDWLYNYLSEERRAVVVQAIAEKGLTPAIPMYLDKTYWWVYNRDNWNFVSNAGMTLGALAIAEDEEELAGLILREAYKSIQYGLPQYAPDGSAIEGPGYWEYGTSYLVYFLSALETSFGHDFGFSETDGIEETPMYPIYIAGPNGSFNYSDNSEAHVIGRLLLWFANRFNKPEYTWYHQFVTDKGSNPGLYDMIWYRPDIYGATEPTYLDQLFERPNAVTMRSNWNDPNALFVGFKGGVNGAPHGHLDAGSFVFDANGVRWALDLGSESYNLPARRWDLYRNSTEGHNTLAIAAPSGLNQLTNAVSEITRTEFERPEGSFAIADLTPAYEETAVSVKRGSALSNHRREFLVQDEVTLKTPSDLYWFMHTRAQIDLDQTGTTAILSQGGRQLAVQLVSPADATFSILPAETLPGSPNPDGQMINHGVQRLTVHLEDVLESTISVRMVPLMDGELPPAPPAIVPLDAWTIEESELALLESIMINGEHLNAFEPNRYVYDIHLQAEEEVPLVEAQAGSGYELTIEQAEQLPGTTRIEVTDPTGSKDIAIYYVVFQTPSQPEIPEGKVHYVPVAVEASTHDGNVPENTLDGDLDTRWSASGEQWIQYDLAEVKDLSAVAIAWYQGNTRQSYFHLELSEDGENWITVYEGASSGETTEFELNEFEETSAQYVRIQGFGNSQNQWNSIAEVMIYGPADEEEPMPITTGSLLELITSLAEEAAFANEQAVRALNMHLTSVQIFEQQENVEKVVQHMEGFLALLDYQKEHELISEQAYNALKADVDALMEQWQ